MATDTLDWIGHSLASGRYRITSRLGEGGMGAVYKAHDANLDNEVVVKVPKPGLVSDHEFTARFAREVRSLVRLAHAHIVRVLDVGEHQGLPFAVMQYLNGGSLRDRLSRVSGGPSAALADLPSWLAGVADALDYIHVQGYVHRDVKPDNILFDAAGHVYLGDFGIAKALAASESSAGLEATFKTSAGLVVGTPQYMAPELITAQGCDGRVDQYALAVTVYEVLCARVPFDGPTPAALVVQHATKPPRPPHEVKSGIPLSFSTAMLRGLAKEPGERFRDCRSLAQALTTAVPAAGRTRGDAAPPDDGKERFTCPHCSAAFRLPSEKRGKTGRCPRCQQKFIVGAPSASAATPAGGLAATPPASPAIAPLPAPATSRAPRKPPPPPRHAEQPLADDSQRLARPLTVLPGDPLDDPPPDKGRWILGGGVAVLFLVLLAAGLGVWVKNKASSGSGTQQGAADAGPGSDSDSLAPSAKSQPSQDDLKEARALLEHAKISFAQREWTQADKDLTRAGKLDPNNPEIFFHLGETLRMEGHFGEAVKNYTKTLSLKPSYLNALCGRGSAYRSQRSFQLALDDLNKALRQQDDFPLALAERGAVYLHQGNYKEAIEDCTNAIKKEDSSAYLAYHTRGSARLFLKDAEKALADLKKATELASSAPDPWVAWTQLAVGYSMKNDDDEAITAAAKAIQLNDHYGLAYAIRGSAYRQKHKLDLALADLNRALELNRDDAFVLAERGDVYLKMVKYKECIDDCTRAIELKTPSYLAYRARGIAFCDKGEVDKAIEDLTASLEGNDASPDPWVAWWARGVAYSKKKKCDSAIKDYEEALKRNPGFLEAYVQRGEAYRVRVEVLLQRGNRTRATTDYELALKDFNHVIAEKPNYVLAYRQRALLYQAARDDAEREAAKASSSGDRDLLWAKRDQLDKRAIEDNATADRLESKSK